MGWCLTNPRLWARVENLLKGSHARMFVVKLHSEIALITDIVKLNVLKESGFLADLAEMRIVRGRVT